MKESPDFTKTESLNSLYLTEFVLQPHVFAHRRLEYRRFDSIKVIIIINQHLGQIGQEVHE